MIGEDPLDLGGQIAFVTGAGQGAGRAIALALARHNAGGVAVNDYYPDRAAAVVEEIKALGVPALAAPVIPRLVWTLSGGQTRFRPLHHISNSNAAHEPREPTIVG